LLQQNKINQVTENKSLQISSRYFFNFLIFLDKADGKSIKKCYPRNLFSPTTWRGGKTRRSSVYPNFGRVLL